MKRLLTLALLGCMALPALACTGLMLTANNGTVINGRTVEFGVPIDLNALFVPQGYSFKGTLPDGGDGLSYTSKYAVIGANAFGDSAVLDGINEAGLAVGAFYFPGYAGYAKPDAANKKMGVSAVEYSNWLLTQFATVTEVKKHFADAVIVPTEPKGWGLVPPFHYVVYDKSGKSVVIEPIDGKLVIYDNPLGVITNSPTFDWHMTNLNNYVNMKAMGAEPVTIDGVKIQSFGGGSGMLGMPGDFTPPSRFVRAAMFSSSAVPVDTGHDAVLQAFHLLNQFDIPKGAVLEKAGKKVNAEYTLATTVKDPENSKYFFRTYDDQTLRMVDLNAYDKKSADLLFLDIEPKQMIIDMSASAKS